MPFGTVACTVKRFDKVLIPLKSGHAFRQHEAQKAEVRRYRAAANQLGSLIGKSLSNLELTTAQLEKLAAAWADVQAMKEKE